MTEIMAWFYEMENLLNWLGIVFLTSLAWDLGRLRR